jgi:hypothetical protein
VSLPFLHWNHDALPGIRIRDSEMLVSIGEIFGDAFHEGIEWAAKEDVIGRVWHDLQMSMSSKVNCMFRRRPCISVMVELVASIFNTHSTCKLLPSCSQIVLFIATI